MYFDTNRINQREGDSSSNPKKKDFNSSLLRRLPLNF